MEEIIKIVCTTGVSTLGLIASVIVAIVQSIKKGNVKKQDSIYEHMLDSMEQAEEVYKLISEKGIDTSFLKKQYVMNELQIYANSKGIKFDLELWSEEIERMIQFSEKINAKAKANTTRNTTNTIKI